MATLSLQSVTRRFGAVPAVDAMSLEVAAGEFVCLLGPSGCGKSTALRLVGGFEDPDEGDVLIDGVSTVSVPPNRRATGMVFQSHALWSHMTVHGNIAFGLKLRKLPAAAVHARVGAALELLGLSGLGQRYPRQLSGGQQQRVALARSLVLEPKILLLDEPFSALDAHLRVRLREELRAIQRRLRQTTVFVTHDQEEAMTLADRIAVMNRGRVEQIGTPAEVYERPATLFVAGFIGAMNVLPARAAGGVLAADPFRVALPQGAALPAADAALTLAARPEDIEIVGAEDEVDARGLVEQVVDLGPVRQLVVACGRDQRVKAQLARQFPVAVGQGVGLRLQRGLVYRDGAAPLEIYPRAQGAILPFRRVPEHRVAGGAAAQ
jgi:putative spermidine/putrescine transport system ATP-binding protein